MCYVFKYKLKIRDVLLEEAYTGLRDVFRLYNFVYFTMVFDIQFVTPNTNNYKH